MPTYHAESAEAAPVVIRSGPAGGGPEQDVPFGGQPGLGDAGGVPGVHRHGAINRARLGPLILPGRGIGLPLPRGLGERGRGRRPKCNVPTLRRPQDLAPPGPQVDPRRPRVRPVLADGGQYPRAAGRGDRHHPERGRLIPGLGCLGSKSKGGGLG